MRTAPPETQFERDMQKLLVDKLQKTCSDWIDTCQKGDLSLAVTMTVMVYTLLKIAAIFADQFFTMDSPKFGRLCESLHKCGSIDEEYLNHGHK